MSNVSDTVVDLARWGGLTQGVCAMDAALAARLCTRAELTDAVDRLATGARGIRSARTATHLTDARSESPGESLSRVRMWQAALPRPDLQHEVHIGDHTYRLDFLWPRTMVIGEFDGRIKYRKNSYGKNAEDTVLSSTSATVSSLSPAPATTSPAGPGRTPGQPTPQPCCASSPATTSTPLVCVGKTPPSRAFLA